jgi:hypothetical protein
MFFRHVANGEVNLSCYLCCCSSIVLLVLVLACHIVSVGSLRCLCVVFFVLVFVNVVIVHHIVGVNFVASIVVVNVDSLHCWCCY